MAHTVFVLNGNPHPLARGLIGGRYAKRHIYDPNRDIKTLIAISLTNQWDTVVIEGPVALHADFYFPLPIHNRRKHKVGDWHSSPPDLSNLTKFIEDCSQQVGILKNDCTIAETIVRKRYDARPRTEFWYINLEK